jgi:AcrR family transcriptional regulator
MTQKKPYHHGNLREALLEASIHLIAETGPKAFTLREVARRAGVSHNAPYRHFQDKDDLLAAVATQGYGELTEAMLDAARREPQSLDRLKHAGLAYISFALRRPEHFTVMFEAPLSKAPPSEATDAAQRAFNVLLGLVHDCQHNNQIATGDPLQFALLAWTMVHGVAKLAITGRLPYRSKAKILEFAGFVIDTSLPGLADGNPSSPRGKRRETSSIPSHPLTR